MWEAETARHNLESENLSLLGIKESHRHNLMTERIGLFDANERARHNLADERARQQELYEARRHNIINEAIGRSNVSLGYAQLRSQERIASMRDRREAERNRNDYQRIKQRDFELVTDRKRLFEAQRHNSAQEQLESQRNNYTLGLGLLNAATNLMKIL